MRKIFTILVLFVTILGANVNAQEVNPYDPHYYATASFTLGNNVMASHDYSSILTCKTYVCSAGLSFQYPVTDVTQWVLGGTLNIGSTGGEVVANITLNTGVHINATKNIYWQAYLTPRVYIHGKGVQTNGDFLETWFTLSTGPGFKYDLPHGYVYVEASISKDIDIIYGQNCQHDNVFMFVTVGYCYRIL